MKLKPRTTTQNTRALVYRRFIGLEKSLSLSIIYNTISDGKFWAFDNLTLNFSPITLAEIPQGSKITQVSDFSSVLQYQDKYFRYNGLEWQNISELGQDITLLSATFNNIAKYQTNKYYYVGSFDFVLKGSVEGTTAQYIKGNIIPLKSFNIKFYEDDIEISADDLVVVGGHLYSIENPETSVKQMPKPFKIHFATLNNIL